MTIDKSQNESAIVVKNLHKSFRLPHEKHSGIKQAVVNIFNGKKGYETQHALRDISFEVEKGEFFGIIGRNGSGKSTLLKLIAGIYAPDSGLIQVNGSLTPFIELGVGFNPELTGRENVFLNGALLGFGRGEMEAMYSDIVQFAELEKFMDQKLKNYSSGMQVRLAFSIAIRADTDILVLDEVLAVGDAAFQRKCYNYFADLKRKKKTVILVTHDMDAVQRFCTKAIYIEDSRVKFSGDKGRVAKAYFEANKEDTTQNEKGKKKGGKRLENTSGLKMQIRSYNQHGEERTSFNPDDKIVLETTISSKVNIDDVVFGLTIEKPNADVVYWFSTDPPREKLPSLKKDTTTKITLEIQNIFGEDTYDVDIALMSKDRSKDYFRIDGSLTIKVTNRGKNGWLIHPNYKVKIAQNGKG